jgi:GDSL-like Lipase/Acylhydrolase family
VRRVLRRIGSGLALLVALGLVLELAFRLGSLWVGGEASPETDGRTVVLCVGDSHTRGRPDPDNYPAELHRILNERADRPYRVINVGVPGLSTGQLRARFPRYLDYYRPAVVLHWAGINNGWHHPDEAPRGLFARVAEHSKLARFVQVAIFYRRLGRETADAAPELLDWRGARAQWRVNFGGKEEEIVTDHGAELPADQVESLTREDLRAMMGLARARSIPMFLVRYDFDATHFRPVNHAIVEVSSEFGVPYVDCGQAAAAVHARGTPREQLYDIWVHPMPIVYRQVAEDAYRLLVNQGIVKPRS